MENKKVFAIAKNASQWYELALLGIVVLMVLPLTIFIPRISHLLGVSEILVIFLMLLFAILLFLFFYKKIYGNFNILTDSQGISYLGLFKNIHASWQEVISVKKSSFLLGKVETQKGNFYFPLTMSEKGGEYPKFDAGMTTANKLMKKANPKLSESAFSTDKWVYKNGIQKEATFENCPLYVEIQQHLGNK
jgi:hypothetical protein